MVLTELHKEHVGMSRMKALARCLVKGTGKGLRGVEEVLLCLLGCETITRVYEKKWNQAFAIIALSKLKW